MSGRDLYPVVNDLGERLLADSVALGADGPPCPACGHPLRRKESWDGLSDAHIKNVEGGPIRYSCGPPWSGHACWCTYPQVTEGP